MATASRESGRHPEGPRGDASSKTSAHDGDITDNDPPPEDNRAMKLLRLAEDAVYYVMGVVLLVAAAVVIVFSLQSFMGAASNTETAMLEVLDGLLLVFIFVELLYAVRVTIARHEIAAEPFLVIGIIASIKEIVVLSVEAAAAVGDMSLFDDRLLLIGVLSGTALALSLAILLLRRSQVFPSE